MSTTTKKRQSVMPRPNTLKVARWAAQGKYDKIHEFLSEIISTARDDSAWKHYSIRFLEWLKNPAENEPLFNIFTKGNSKLPFYSFSTLPLVTCPGKGECASFCYSLKAWRYPHAFYRQVQNTILIKQYPHVITKAFIELPQNVDVRLYVDGDIDSIKTMDFWFKLLNVRDDLKAYGYSKSWELFIEYKNSGKSFPSNYKLNLSSGSKYDNIGTIRAEMKALPITRGEFIAVDAGKKPTKKDVITAAKNSGLKKIFVCPGKCGCCIKKGENNTHACGSNKMKNTNIVIGMH
jgi:hypothetical protein